MIDWTGGMIDWTGGMMEEWRIRGMMDKRNDGGMMEE
jgi:hypothetical protein